MLKGKYCDSSYFDYLYLSPDHAFEDEILQLLHTKPHTSYELSLILREDILVIVELLKRLIGKDKIVRIERGDIFYKLKKDLRVKQIIIPGTIISHTIFKYIGDRHFKPISNFRGGIKIV